jgi:hypothetical protein
LLGVGCCISVLTPAEIAQVALRDPGKMLSWINVGGVPIPVITAAPSALLVLFLTSLFVVLEVVDVATSSREHSSGKFHDHESTAGTVLMIVQARCCMRPLALRRRALRQRGRYLPRL